MRIAIQLYPGAWEGLDFFRWVHSLINSFFLFFHPFILSDEEDWRQQGCSRDMPLLDNPGGRIRARS